MYAVDLIRCVRVAGWVRDEVSGWVTAEEYMFSYVYCFGRVERVVLSVIGCVALCEEVLVPLRLVGV